MSDNNIILIGIPARPIFGKLISGPNSGEVTIQIKTIASGIDNVSQGFQFNIIAVRDGVKLGNVREFVLNDYRSGHFETIVFSDLEQGQYYTFSATAVNVYGTSDVANSSYVIAGR